MSVTGNDSNLNARDFMNMATVSVDVNHVMNFDNNDENDEATSSENITNNNINNLSC